MAESGHGARWARDVEAIERAMVRIRTHITRRRLGRLFADDMDPDSLAHLAVVDAVENAGPEQSAEMTVGAIADRLGIDPSRGSRMVAAAIDEGYVERMVSQADGRRSVIALTARGRELAQIAHRTRRNVFGKAVTDWSAAERSEFARLLTKFIDGLESITE